MKVEVVVKGSAELLKAVMLAQEEALKEYKGEYNITEVVFTHLKAGDK